MGLDFQVVDGLENGLEKFVLFSSIPLLFSTAQLVVASKYLFASQEFVLNRSGYCVNLEHDLKTTLRDVNQRA